MKLTTKIIADKVIEVTGYDIRLKNREVEYVRGRWVYTKLCRTFLSNSLTVIGREVGLNHATIINNLKNIENPHRFDINCYNQFTELESQIIDEYKITPPKAVENTFTDKYNTEEIKRLKGQLNTLKRDYTKLSVKTEEQKETIKELRKQNTKLIEENFKHKLKL